MISAWAVMVVMMVLVVAVWTVWVHVLRLLLGGTGRRIGLLGRLLMAEVELNGHYGIKELTSSLDRNRISQLHPKLRRFRHWIQTYRPPRRLHAPEDAERRRLSAFLAYLEKGIAHLHLHDGWWFGYGFPGCVDSHFFANLVTLEVDSHQMTLDEARGLGRAIDTGGFLQLQELKLRHQCHNSKCDLPGMSQSMASAIFTVIDVVTMPCLSVIDITERCANGENSCNEGLTRYLGFALGKRTSRHRVQKLIMQHAGGKKVAHGEYEFRFLGHAIQNGKCKAMRHLDFTACPLTPTFMRFLGDALVSGLLPRLEYLELRDTLSCYKEANGNHGQMGLLELLNGLRLGTHTSLKHLGLGCILHTPEHQEAVRALLEWGSCPNLNSIDFEWSEEMQPVAALEMWRPLFTGDYRGLRCLRMATMTLQVGEALANAIAARHFPVLEELQLSDLHGDGTGYGAEYGAANILQSLTSLRGLRRLTVTGLHPPDIAPVGFPPHVHGQALLESLLDAFESGALRHLTEFHLSCNMFETDESLIARVIEHLHSCAELEILTMCWCRMGCECLMKIAVGLHQRKWRRLRILELASDDWVHKHDSQEATQAFTRSLMNYRSPYLERVLLHGSCPITFGEPHKQLLSLLAHRQAMPGLKMFRTEFGTVRYHY